VCCQTIKSDWKATQKLAETMVNFKLISRYVQLVGLVEFYQAELVGAVRKRYGVLAGLKVFLFSSLRSTKLRLWKLNSLLLVVFRHWGQQQHRTRCSRTYRTFWDSEYRNSYYRAEWRSRLECDPCMARWWFPGSWWRWYGTWDYLLEALWLAQL
jgi:hypothetical protein